MIAILMVLAAPLGGVAAQSNGQAGQGNTGLHVVVTITANPSDDDKDWPIIKVETEKKIDKNTGQVVTWTTITRRGPTKKICNNTESVMATTCTYVDPQSRSSISSSVGGVVTHITHYADHYCTDGCTWNLYKPTRLEVWWTRPGTSVTVKDADTKWGCTAACQLCDGSQYIYYYDSGTFQPTWLNSTQSYTYVYTTTPSGPFPPLYAAYLAVISGANTAYVYQGSTNLGSVGTFAAYPS